MFHVLFYDLFSIDNIDFGGQVCVMGSVVLVGLLFRFYISLCLSMP